jgi:hypothetical protein
VVGNIVNFAYSYGVFWGIFNHTGFPLLFKNVIILSKELRFTPPPFNK